MGVKQLAQSNQNCFSLLIIKQIGSEKGQTFKLYWQKILVPPGGIINFWNGGTNRQIKEEKEGRGAELDRDEYLG